MPNRISIYRRMERFVFFLTRRPRYLRFMRHVSTAEEIRIVLQKHEFNVLETSYVGEIAFLSRMLRLMKLPRYYESLFLIVAQRA